ncbi:hypothetical protein [Rhodococcus sp. PvP104]|uniref:hypothetical protein n=3 Tax=Nocardiaceae TaxID=85025 RepID=UPI00071808CD|nr:hypothetical protein [Rhodococcus sp. PvP104]MBP2521058.1 hypothetical protein [Rhodococcus sp. PvP104]
MQPAACDCFEQDGVMTREWRSDEVLHGQGLPAGWIEDRMGQPFSGTVHSIFPGGFEAYARIFHPAVVWNGQEAESVSWSDVAVSGGLTVHPQMQWESIYRKGVDSALYVDDLPAIGRLAPGLRRELAAMLAEFTTSRECYFAFWEGNFDETQISSAPGLESTSGRRYHVFLGSLSRAGHTFAGESPNLWWPADGEWFVSTDIDLMSTFVAGSERCIEQILDSSTLEALRADLGHGITVSSDTVNPR